MKFYVTIVDSHLGRRTITVHCETFAEAEQWVKKNGYIQEDEQITTIERDWTPV